MTRDPQPFPSRPPALPLAELSYASLAERAAVRPVLAIVMAIPAAELVRELTLLVVYVQQVVFSGFNSSSVSRSIYPITVAVVSLLVCLLLLVTAAIGWRDRRVGPTAVVSLIYGILMTCGNLATFAYQWSQFGTGSWIGSYVIQRMITSVAPAIVPLVAFVALRRLAEAWGERA